MLDQKSKERIIKQFKTSEICPVLEQWGYFSKHDINSVRTAGSKQEMIREFCELCAEQEIGEDAIGDLDILNLQLHSKRKLWHVYELTDAKEETRKTSLSPAGVQEEISRNLGQYYDSVVSSRMLDKALWIRLSLTQGTLFRNNQMKMVTDVIYIVHYPRTDFFISSPLKAAFKANVIESMMSVLGYFASRDLQLKGHCLTSLADIVFNRNVQGGFGAHRPERHHADPLTSHHRKKRKEPDEEIDERITREDDRKRLKRTEVLEKTFGPYVQPALEKVEFKLETEFRGFDVGHKGGPATLSGVEKCFPSLERKYRNTAQSEVFKCRVKFEGKNVLEGLRNLGKRGIASVPLPKHLSSIRSQARSYFVLVERRRNARNMRSPA